MNGSLTTLPDSAGAGHHRVIMPFLSFPDKHDLKLYTGLSDNDHEFYKDIKFIKPYLDNENIFNWQNQYRVYRFERMCTTAHLKMIESMRKCFPHSFFIWDCCDNVFNINPDNRIAYQYYSPKRLDNIRKMCDIVDRVCVSTPNIKATFIKEGVDPDKIVLVPNVLYKKFYPVKQLKERNLKEEDEIRFIWFGSSSYWLDVKELVFPQMRALKEAIPNAKFYLQEHIQKMTQPDFDVEIIDWIKPCELGQFLFNNDFHFGFHLMRNNEFNLSRTSSKVKEMIFSGGMVPISYLEDREEDGYLNKVLNPDPEGTVDYVQSIINGDISFKEMVEFERYQHEGTLWFEDHLDEYKKLFGIDILENGI